MARALALLLAIAPAAAVGAVVAGAVIAGSLWREGLIDGALVHETIARALGLALVGRGILALLPAGDPGGAASKDGAVVWATSAVLGGAWSAILSPTATAREALAVPLLWVPLAIAGALWMLGPAGLRPRHRHLALPDPRASLWERGARLAVALAVGAVVLLPGGSVLGVALVSMGALALAAAGVAPQAAVAAGAGLGAAVAIAGVWVPTDVVLDALHPAHAPAGALLALAGATLWLRRADRRGLALAALGLAIASAAAPFFVLALALVALVTATAAAGRRRALPWVAAALAAGAYAARDRLFALPSLSDLGTGPGAERSPWIAAGAALLLGLLWIARVRSKPDLPGVIDGDPPRARRAPAGRELDLALALGALWLFSPGPLGLAAFGFAGLVWVLPRAR